MSKFIKDFAKGKIGENKVLTLFRDAGLTAEFYTGPNKDADITVEFNDRQILGEVKYDIKSSLTGNIAIEIFNTKTLEESGLSSTKAALIIYVLPFKGGHEIHAANVSRLREYVKNISPCRTIMDAGDGNAMILLYKKDRILPAFVRLDELNPEPLMEILKELIKE